MSGHLDMPEGFVIRIHRALLDCHYHIHRLT